MKRSIIRQLLLIIILLTSIAPLTTYATSEVPKTIDTTKYCYNQLNDREKAIYNIFINSKEKFINNEEIYCTRVEYQDDYKEVYKEFYNSIQRAMQAYISDNPDAEIWVKDYETKEKLVNYEGNYYYDVSIVPFFNGYTNLKSGEATQLIHELEKTVDEFVKTLHGTDYDKLLQIHNWLINNSKYDMTHSNINRRNAYGSVIQKNATCSGYSYGFKYISDKAGLNVICVSGTATNYDGITGRHSWNLAYIDGEWKLIDVTWDIQAQNKKEFFLKSIKTEQKTGRHIAEKYFFSYPQ